ncbi:bifunctional tetrahydrofolate synthase/dihydrofolate synthase [Propionivibrio dicarboxylicus]|uniref:bifunctional tetrahydrofolate synthase/dihydrofolate synthase n=1 Tax=Propionivibrio dicarboxylicus TaxID=83767 RepID=UPI001FE1FA57|nr:bifunctional tetrahydrofolate synthase/dihydrofolate synthase [Propionivibrio dicarboxylicus]
MKRLNDWLTHLESLHPKGQAGIELGLERVARVKAELRQRQHCPVIVVGGTNGKGSTCATLEAIYRAAGVRTACYSSPHLLAYNERVRVDGVPVSDADLVLAFARVEAARQAAGGIALTYFEFGTLAAWEVFAAQGVGVAILEVGLGGRLDAVNVYDADCAVVTGVALDHTDWLGTTREAIGFEKAGIYRAGRPALCADPAPPESLCAHAASIGADLRLIGRDFTATADGSTWTFVSGDTRWEKLPLPALRGACQLRNAAGALTAVTCLQSRLPVTRAAVETGLRAVRLTGRFDIIGEHPRVIVDVAHNPQATAGLAENLDALPCAGKTLAVVGMLADKDIAGALANLTGRVDVWLVAGLDVPRGAPADAVQRVVAGLGGNVETFDSPTAAFARAVGLAGENDRIAAFGSFHTVAAVLRAVAARGDSPLPPGRS